MYSGDLNNEHLNKGNIWMLNFQMFGIQMAFDYWTIWQSNIFDHLNTRLVWYSNPHCTSVSRPFSFLGTLSKLKIVCWTRIMNKRMPTCFHLYWSGIQMVGLVYRTYHVNQPIEYQTIWNPNLYKVRYQIPIVYCHQWYLAYHCTCLRLTGRVFLV